MSINRNLFFYIQAKNCWFCISSKTCPMTLKSTLFEFNDGNFIENLLLN